MLVGFDEHLLFIIIWVYTSIHPFLDTEHSVHGVCELYTLYKYMGVYAEGGVFAGFYGI